jgi:hypothetical protein
MLLSSCGKPYLPSCDDCARGTYDRHPDVTVFAPLAGYVDMFEAAKEAALATPEQFDDQAARDATDEAILHRSHEDHVIYCREWWCIVDKRLTPAEVITNDGGSHWKPACASCASQRQADINGPRIQVAALDEGRKAQYWAMLDAAKPAAPAQGNQLREWTAEEKAQAAAGGQPPAGSHGAGWVIGLSLLGSFILGVILAIAGWRQTLADDTATPPELMWGAFFIALPFLVGFIALLVSIAKGIAEESRQTRQQYSQGGVSYQQGGSVRWYQNPDVVNAALVGGAAVAAHEAQKARQRRVVDSALGIAPLNNVHAGMKRTTYMLGRPADTQDGIRYELEQLNTQNPKWTRQ